MTTPSDPRAQQAEILRALAKSWREYPRGLQSHLTEAAALDAGAAALSPSSQIEESPNLGRPIGPDEWKRAALCIGEHLAPDGPAGYGKFNAYEWWLWAGNTLGEQAQAAAALSRPREQEQPSALVPPSRPESVEQAKDELRIAAGRLRDATKLDLLLAMGRFDEATDELILAVQQASLVPQGWQPIATAPKGEDVLIAKPSERVMSDDDEDWLVFQKIAYLTDFGSWCDNNGDEIGFEPTHWMPFPAPPLSPDPPQEQS